MKPRSDQTLDVGVIVGRFQVPYLHDEHRDLIQTVLDRHSRVIVFLGLAPENVPTKNNPLDFRMREAMLKEEFPDVEVYYIKDVPGDNDAWSHNLDVQVKSLVSPNHTVMLYGGRDSFIRDPRTDEPIYSGRYSTCELEPEDGQYADTSGTAIRRAAGQKIKASRDFRHGMCYAVANQYDKCMPTVDVAVFNETGTKILLARKPDEAGWRFIGGFAEHRRPTYEEDVREEVREEAGIEVTEPVYLFSCAVDDPRYRGEPDGIKTAMFMATYVSGDVKAADDIKEAKWFDWEPFGHLGWADTDPLSVIVDTHRPLMEKLRKRLAGKSPLEA